MAIVKLSCLGKKKNTRPIDPTVTQPPDADIVEVKATALATATSHSCHGGQRNIEQKSGLSSLIHYHSSWYKLTRATAWLMRARDWLRQSKPRQPISPMLNLAGLRSAQSVSHVQAAHFQEDIAILSSDQPLHQGSGLPKLNPKLRQSMLVVCGRATLHMNHEQLHTFIMECEQVLNSRPAVSDDPRDLQALTQSMLLGSADDHELPIGASAGDGDFLRRRWRAIQAMTHPFWHRWRRKYLQKPAAKNQMAHTRTYSQGE